MTGALNREDPLPRKEGLILYKMKKHDCQPLLFYTLIALIGAMGVKPNQKLIL